MTSVSSPVSLEAPSNYLPYTNDGGWSRTILVGIVLIVILVVYIRTSRKTSPFVAQLNRKPIAVSSLYTEIPPPPSYYEQQEEKSAYKPSSCGWKTPW